MDLESLPVPLLLYEKIIFYCYPFPFSVLCTLFVVLFVFFNFISPFFLLFPLFLPFLTSHLKSSPGRNKELDATYEHIYTFCQSPFLATRVVGTAAWWRYLEEFMREKIVTLTLILYLSKIPDILKECLKITKIIHLLQWTYNYTVIP